MTGLDRRALIALCIVVGVGVSVGAQDTVTVFVGPQVRDGFADVDAGVRDSIKDIQQECQAGGLAVVDTPDRAKLSVLVLGRGLPVRGDVGLGSGTVTAGTGTAFAMTVPNTVPTITTVLRVGRYERTTSRDGGNWRNAAKMVVEDLKAWVDANRAALRESGRH